MTLHWNLNLHFFISAQLLVHHFDLQHLEKLWRHPGQLAVGGQHHRLLRRQPRQDHCQRWTRTLEWSGYGGIFSLSVFTSYVFSMAYILWNMFYLNICRFVYVCLSFFFCLFLSFFPSFFFLLSSFFFLLSSFLRSSNINSVCIALKKFLHNLCNLAHIFFHRPTSPG